MDQLPNELLEKILLSISTTSLLRTCRLVSRQWNHVSSYVCRKRHVMFKQIRYKNLQKGDHRLCACYISTFVGREDDIPWSSIQLPVDENMQGTLSLAIVLTFGRQLRSLSICLDYTGYFTFMLILNQVPQLRTLHLRSLRSDLERPFIYPTDDYIYLPKLKQLKIDHEDTSEKGFQFLQLLEFLLAKSKRSLKSITHTFLYGVSETYFQRTTQMTQNIPNLSLELPYWIDVNAWEILAKQKNGTVVQLAIHRYHRFMSAERWQFKLLEQFLSNCTQLDTLELQEFFTASYHPILQYELLTIPILENVKKLTFASKQHIDTSYTFLLPTKYCDRENTLPFWAPIDPFNLPALESVHVLIDIGQHLRLEKVFKLSAGLKIFAKVKNLEFRVYDDDVCLADVFPSIVKLKFTATPSSNINAILCDMTNLRQLHVKFASFEFDNHEVILRDLTSAINHLPELQCLTLSGGDKGMNLRESGFNLLMSIQPIQLTLENIEIPVKWAAALRNHHVRYTDQVAGRL